MTKKTPPQIIGTVYENLDKIYTGNVIRITQTTTPLAVYIPGAIWTGQKYQTLPLTPLKNLLYNRSYVKQLNAWSCRAGKTTKIVNFVILVVEVLTSEPGHTSHVLSFVMLLIVPIRQLNAHQQTIRSIFIIMYKHDSISRHIP